MPANLTFVATMERFMVSTSKFTRNSKLKSSMNTLTSSDWIWNLICVSLPCEF